MYIILDKVHRVLQVGLSRDALTVEASGARMAVESAFAFEDARTLSCNLPLSFDRIAIQAVHYRMPISKNWAYRMLYSSMVRAIQVYRVLRPVFEKSLRTIERHRTAISVGLTVLIIAHAFWLLSTPPKVEVPTKPQKPLNFDGAMKYWQETKLAKRMDLERHAFVVDEAFYYGASKGHLAIPVTAHRSRDYSGKPFVVLIKVKNAFAVANGARIESTRKDECQKGVVAHLFDGKAKLVVFPDTLPTKVLRRFVLTESVESSQPSVNLCDEYAALIEHFAEL